MNTAYFQDFCVLGSGFRFGLHKNSKEENLTIRQGAIDGSLDFNLISLFPPTYKNRKNGLRKDLAEALQELNPVRTHYSRSYFLFLVNEANAGFIVVSPISRR